MLDLDRVGHVQVNVQDFEIVVASFRKNKFDTGVR